LCLLGFTLGCGSAPAPSNPGNPAAPFITAVTPTSAVTVANSEIQISGGNFAAGVAVWFGGLPAASTTFVSSSQLVAVTPAAPAGVTTLRVVNPGGGEAVFQGFRFVEAKVYFQDNFETCDYSKYWDVANNVVSATTARGQCSSQMDPSLGFGKLLANLSEPAADVWVRAWLFFPDTFLLPGGMAGMHLFRLHEVVGAPGLQFDPNVPAGGSGVQLFVVGGTAQEWFVNTGFNPIADGRAGRWQCWEFRLLLNTPGQSDGRVEFYAEGQTVHIAPSLRLRDTADQVFRVMDVQSNIGGNAATWPVTNTWYIDDVIATNYRYGCNTPLPIEASLNGSTEGQELILSEDFESGEMSGWAASNLFVTSEQAAGGRFAARAVLLAESAPAESATAYFGDYLSERLPVFEVAVVFDFRVDSAEGTQIGGASRCSSSIARLLSNDDGLPLYRQPLPASPYALLLCLNSELELRLVAWDGLAEMPLRVLLPNLGPAQLELGRWHHILFRTHLNSAGESDGTAELWLDSQLVAQHTDLRFRGGTVSKGWNMFQLAGEPIGQAFAVSRQYWDNVRVYEMSLTR
jgi:hypothetical protein